MASTRMDAMIPRGLALLLLKLIRRVLMYDRGNERLIREALPRSFLLDAVNIALAEPHAQCPLLARGNTVGGNFLPFFLRGGGDGLYGHIRVLERLDELALLVVEVLHVGVCVLVFFHSMHN